MYRTRIANRPVGPFGGNLVVSMRPYVRHTLRSIIKITRRYPEAHGSPIFWGKRGLELLVSDLGQPDWGDEVTIKKGEIPVFWACGVSSQTALESAGVPIAFTHAPGHMFISDMVL